MHDDLKVNAKRKAIEALRKGMRDLAHSPIMKGMAVKVASDSKEGLLKGLEKAKEIAANEDNLVPEDAKKDEELAEIQDDVEGESEVPEEKEESPEEEAKESVEEEASEDQGPEYDSEDRSLEGMDKEALLEYIKKLKK